MNLSVLDGLQINLTPLHPNGCAAQQTVQRVIVQYDHGLTVDYSDVLTSTECVTPPMRECDQIQVFPQSGDRCDRRCRRRRSQSSAPIAQRVRDTGSGDWRHGRTQVIGRESGGIIGRSMRTWIG